MATNKVRLPCATLVGLRRLQATGCSGCRRKGRASHKILAGHACSIKLAAWDWIPRPPHRSPDLPIGMGDDAGGSTGVAPDHDLLLLAQSTTVLLALW